MVRRSGKSVATIDPYEGLCVGCLLKLGGSYRIIGDCSRESQWQVAPMIHSKFVHEATLQYGCTASIKCEWWSFTCRCYVRVWELSVLSVDDECPVPFERLLPDLRIRVCIPPRGNSGGQFFFGDESTHDDQRQVLEFLSEKFHEMSDR